MKTFKLVMRLYINHIVASLIAVFMIIPLYNAAQNVPHIYSLLTTLIYIAIVYTSAWRIGARDARKIPGYYPDKRMPLRLSIYTAIVPIILLILRIAAPNIWHINLPFMNGEYDFFVTGCTINGTPDLIYRLWYFSYAAFIPSGNIIAYAAEILILPIIIYAGYYVGLKKFSMMEYLYVKAVFSSDPNKQGKGKKRKREDRLRR